MLSTLSTKGAHENKYYRSVARRDGVIPVAVKGVRCDLEADQERHRTSGAASRSIRSAWRRRSILEVELQQRGWRRVAPTIQDTGDVRVILRQTDGRRVEAFGRAPAAYVERRLRPWRSRRCHLRARSLERALPLLGVCGPP
jgi:hypothetical protein